MTEAVVKFERKKKLRRRKPEAVRCPASPPDPSPTLLARMLAYAHSLERRLESEEFRRPADLARRLGISRARLSQLQDLLLLAPAIQEKILALDVDEGVPNLSERDIRPLIRMPLWSNQVEAWCGTDFAEQRPPHEAS